MASSSVSQEEVEKDFQLLNRRSKIRIARARNPPAHSQRPGEEMEAEDREESPKPLGKIKDRRTVRTNERPNFASKGKVQRDRRKLREKRRSTGVVHLQSTESTGGSTGEDDGEESPSREETKRNTGINEGIDVSKADSKNPGNHNYIGPSDLEADDEDTQDGDSLNHLKLDTNLTELTIKEDVAVESPLAEGAEYQVLVQAKDEVKQLSCQLADARREISLLKAERDFLREQNLGLRNQALAAKK